MAVSLTNTSVASGGDISYVAPSYMTGFRVSGLKV